MKPDQLETQLLNVMNAFTPLRMSPETSGILISLLLASPEQQETIYNGFIKKAWQIKAVEMRISSTLTCTVDNLSLCLITVLTEGNIGKMMLYVYYLQYWAKANNKRNITIQTLCEEIFSKGFFSDEDLTKFWGLQKVEGGNLIDFPEAAQSIQFKEND